MDNKVFFKIVIPNYNNIAYIAKCLDSILTQTFQDFKIIVVDDLSTDFSYELAKVYERKFPDKIKVVRMDKKGYAGGARNRGIDYPIDCEYYYFIDSDDYLCSKASLEKLFNSVGDRPDILLFSFNFLQEDGKIRESFRSKKKFERFIGNFATSGWNSASARIVKHDKIEYFLENCMRAEDTYQWLKLLDENPSIKQIYDDIFTYRLHSNSATHISIFNDDRPKFVNALLALRSQCKNKHVIQSIDNRLKLN